MKNCAIVLAAIAAMTATPSLAQEGKDVSFVVGPIVGYDSVTLSDGSISESDDGVLYGAVAGVDYRLNDNAFVGVEAEFTDSDVSDSVTDVVVAGDRATVKAGRNLYLGARAGVMLSSATRLYAKGGYSNAEAKGSYDDTAETYKVSDKLDGWVLGAGVETRLAPVALRLEYRYSDYENIKLLGIDTGVDASRHQVLAGALLAF